MKLKSSLWVVISLLGAICALTIFFSCSNGDTTEGGDTEKSITSSPQSKPLPLNLSIFVDLSDRILKEKNGMRQYEKDQAIINGLAKSFINKQTKNGFSKSEDCFQVVFYPAPAGADSLAENLSLDLKATHGPKKKPLLNFKQNQPNHTKDLYDRAINEQNFFGSDIWGFFSKDKVSDLCKPDYRNVLVILSDGYLYDANNKIKDGKNYSYILPQTLGISGSGLIPCKISNTDIEIYFMECNATPETDYPKMKKVLENWFNEMGIDVVDIQDTDIPVNILKHLSTRIFE